MSGPELCPKCKGLHFKTAPCIVRKPSTGEKIIEGMREALAVAKGEVEPYAVHKRPVGRPRTITDMKAYKAKWARDYRARKASKSNPNTPERND